MWGRPLKKFQDDAQCEKRRWPRLRCAVATEFADPEGNTWSCKIVDMSESGFAIATSVGLTMGNIVDIICPPVVAEVVWVRDNMVGLGILV